MICGLGAREDGNKTEGSSPSGSGGGVGAGRVWGRAKNDWQACSTHLPLLPCPTGAAGGACAGWNRFAGESVGEVDGDGRRGREVGAASLPSPRSRWREADSKPALILLRCLARRNALQTKWGARGRGPPKGRRDLCAGRRVVSPKVERVRGPPKGRRAFWCVSSGVVLQCSSKSGARARRRDRGHAGRRRVRARRARASRATSAA